MSKINSIQKQGCINYTAHRHALFTFITIAYIPIVIVPCSFIPWWNTTHFFQPIVYGSFLPIQVLFQFLFYYNIEYPRTFTYQGNKYKRLRASIANRQLTQVHLYDIWIFMFKLFLYTIGVKKIIIIGECKEINDIKVQCPYCKAVMEVEEVQEKCPICSRSLDDYIYIGPYYSSI